MSVLLRRLPSLIENDYCAPGAVSPQSQHAEGRAAWPGLVEQRRAADGPGSVLDDADPFARRGRRCESLHQRIRFEG
ncbi:MAG: hypothetical protein OEY03_11920, partial [Rhizobacter sp.]|nr:hypothetical protein [Rhizobacter sp.]